MAGKTHDGEHRALAFQQPYATKIALGIKTVECRSRRINPVSDLVVCASKTARSHPPKAGYPYGYAVGLVDVVACVPFTSQHLEGALMDWFDPEVDKWAWILANPRTIEPFPVHASASFFYVPDRIVPVKIADTEGYGRLYGRAWLAGDDRVRERNIGKLMKEAGLAVACEAPTAPAKRLRSLQERLAGEAGRQNSRARTSDKHRSAGPRSYVCASLPRTSVAGGYEDAGLGEIERRMRAVLDAEGPVEKQRLFNEVRESFDVARSGRLVQERNERAFKAIPHDTVRWDGRSFVSPKGFELDGFRTTLDDGTAPRSVDQIPPAELDRAIAYALAENGPMGEEGLLRAVAGIFGNARVASRIRRVLGKKLADGVPGVAGHGGTFALSDNG